MNAELKPATDWKERIAPDESERFARYAQEFAAIQERKSKKYGPGRALHRKQTMAAQGTLQVLGRLPKFARHGLFAAPGEYAAWVRLSNGGMDRAKDSLPDIRGFAISVAGVQGDAALGNGPATRQDFTLINHEVFAFPKSDEFVDFVLAAGRGGAALLKFLVQRYGLVGAPLRMLKMLKTMGKPFGGFATETFFSAVPIACGPYAVRVRLVPAPENGKRRSGAKRDWGLDFSARLARQDLQWDLQLQPFVSEELTPIEDASVNWPTEYVSVARLILPEHDMACPGGRELQEKVEAAVFDPWQALAAHRPLGDVQRARKVVYFASQKGRSAAG